MKIRAYADYPNNFVLSDTKCLGNGKWCRRSEADQCYYIADT